MDGSGSGSSSPGESTPRRRTILEILSDGDEVDIAMRRAVREALIEHKKLGHTIVVWQDGKIVKLPPEEIPD